MIVTNNTDSGKGQQWQEQQLTNNADKTTTTCQEVDNNIDSSDDWLAASNHNSDSKNNGNNEKSIKTVSLNNDKRWQLWQWQLKWQEKKETGMTTKQWQDHNKDDNTTLK